MSTKHSLEQIVNVSKEIFKTCSLTDAFIDFTSSNKFLVNSVWSQVDLDKNERTKFQKTYLFETNDNKANLVHVIRPVQVKPDVWNVKSPSNLRIAIVNNWKNNDKDEQFIEIWDNERRLESVNLTRLDKHSKIYENSACLGSLVWSSDSASIAYVAEMKKSNTEKCFFTSKLKKENSIDDKSKDEVLTEYNFEKKYANYYVDEWGEQYVGKSQSVVSVFNLDTLEVKVLEKFPQDYAPGQISWYKNEGLIINAYYTKPYSSDIIKIRLNLLSNKKVSKSYYLVNYEFNLILCNMRSELFYYDLIQDTCTQLTDFRSDCLRDPQFSHDFEQVCWLQNQANGPHFRCSKLMIMKWSTKEIKTLVDIVKEDDGFPGLFSIKFPSKCWSLDNKRILIDTHWKKANRIISVDVDTKKVESLENGIDELNSIQSLKISNDWICAVLEGYNLRPCLVVGKLPKRGDESKIEWSFTETCDYLHQKANVQLLNLTPKINDPHYSNLKFQAILVEASQRNNSLVVFPHGGPHSAFCCEFSAHVAIFYSLGFSVLLVNYRGSAGYGQNSIDSLPGKVGNNDVNDVQQAAEYAMTKFNFDQAYVYGGSHGGFLTTHLIGQFPDFYKAASARNPVTNLESMHHLSDIPDWICCEGFGVYDFDLNLFNKPDSLAQLFDKSPIKHVNNVKTPVLIMIGNVDLRVPPSQGLQYYKNLIARNATAKLLVFKEDCHPLDKPQTTADCIVSTVLWFEKYSN